MDYEELAKALMSPTSLKTPVVPSLSNTSVSNRFNDVALKPPKTFKPIKEDEEEEEEEKQTSSQITLNRQVRHTFRDELHQVKEKSKNIIDLSFDAILSAARGVQSNGEALDEYFKQLLLLLKYTSIVLCLVKAAKQAPASTQETKEKFHQQWEKQAEISTDDKFNVFMVLMGRNLDNLPFAKLEKLARLFSSGDIARLGSLLYACCGYLIDCACAEEKRNEALFDAGTRCNLLYQLISASQEMSRLKYEERLPAHKKQLLKKIKAWTLFIGTISLLLMMVALIIMLLEIWTSVIVMATLGLTLGLSIILLIVCFVTHVNIDDKLAGSSKQSYICAKIDRHFTLPKEDLGMIFPDSNPSQTADDLSKILADRTDPTIRKWILALIKKPEYCKILTTLTASDTLLAKALKKNKQPSLKMVRKSFLRIDKTDRCVSAQKGGINLLPPGEVFSPKRVKSLYRNHRSGMFDLESMVVSEFTEEELNDHVAMQDRKFKSVRKKKTTVSMFKQKSKLFLSNVFSNNNTDSPTQSDELSDDNETTGLGLTIRITSSTSSNKKDDIQPTEEATPPDQAL